MCILKTIPLCMLMLLSVLHCLSTHSMDIFDAIGAGDLGRIRHLIEENPKIVNQDYGATPLLSAANHGNVAVVKLLLDSGANINKQSGTEKINPLYGAVDSGHFAIVTLLIGAGANINQQNRLGETPLYCAAEKNYTEIALILIKAGANANLTENGYGMSPLHKAAVFGNVAIINALVAAGANLDRQTRSGATPL